MAAQDRLLWPDYTKGICIILVVFFHAGTNTITAGIKPTTEVWDFVNDFISTFMVPAFFFVSGFFASKPIGSGDRRGVLTSIAKNLLYPYVVWTILQAALIVVCGRSNTKADWHDLPHMLLNGSMQFWFLHALIVVFVVDLVFGQMVKSVLCRFLASVFLLIGISFVQPMPWVSEFGKYYVYFSAGVFAFQRKRGAMNPADVFALGTVSFVSLFAMVWHQAGVLSALRPIGAFLGITGCICMTSILPASRGMRWLQQMGIYSLPVYCLHLFFLGGCRWILQRLGLQNFEIHHLAGFVAGIVGPLAIAELDRRYLGFLFRFPKRPARIVPAASERCVERF